MTIHESNREQLFCFVFVFKKKRACEQQTCAGVACNGANSRIRAVKFASQFSTSDASTLNARERANELLACGGGRTIHERTQESNRNPNDECKSLELPLAESLARELAASEWRTARRQTAQRAGSCRRRARAVERRRRLADAATPDIASRHSTLAEQNRKKKTTNQTQKTKLIETRFSISCIVVYT